MPPYHPAYGEQESHQKYPLDSESEEDEYEHPGRQREFVRRGSEGYEVRSIDREALLRRYVEDRTAEPGRYQLYVPNPPSEPESGAEDEEERMPLSEKVEMWRTRS